ncbi:hypothetical protein KFE25_003738 [Diacronema lutheri]|uniref:TLC domain-containing protein n=1 Tax=Diacronema lutheri TaxID=2081491 RepID=A0A8J6C1I2_DIALT|nr:hypothetical protein KFE25_003738 [Diacronema lutheri]
MRHAAAHVGGVAVATLAAHVVSGVAAATVAFYMARRGIGALFPHVPRRQRSVAALAAVSFSHNVFVTTTAMRIARYRTLLEGDPQWLVEVPGFELPALACVSFFLFDVWMSRLWTQWSWVLAAHHAFSIFCLAGGALTGAGQVWLAYALSTELSSTFLSCRTLIALLGDKSSAAYAIVTALFALSFLLFRTLPLPFLLRAWLRQPPIGAAACGPTRMAQVMGPMSLLHPIMNAHWTVAIVRVALRRRGGRSGERAQRAHAKSGENGHPTGGAAGGGSRRNAGRKGE